MTHVISYLLKMTLILTYSGAVTIFSFVFERIVLIVLLDSQVVLVSRDLSNFCIDFVPKATSVTYKCGWAVWYLRQLWAIEMLTFSIKILFSAFSLCMLATLLGLAYKALEHCVKLVLAICL